MSFTVYHRRTRQETTRSSARWSDGRSSSRMRTASWRRRAMDHLYGSIAVEGGNEDLTAEIREPGRYAVDQPLITAVAARSWRRPGLGERPRGDAGYGGRGHRDDPGTSLPGPRRRDHGRRAFPALQAGAGVGHAGDRGADAGTRHDRGGVRALAGCVIHATRKGFVTQHGPDFRSDPDSSAIAFLGTWQERRANALGHRHRRRHAVRRRDADRDPHDRDGRGAGRGADGLPDPSGRHAEGGRRDAQADRPRAAVRYGAVLHRRDGARHRVGLLLAPVIANTSVTILGTPQPQLTWTQVAIVGGVALLVVLIGWSGPRSAGCSATP